MTTVALCTPFDNPPQMRAHLDEAFTVVEVPPTPALPAGIDLPAIEGLVTSSHEGVPDWVWDAPNLRVIGNFGVGYDGLDPARAATQGVWVTNTPGVLCDEVADLALALMLSVVRELPQAMAHVRQGQWPAGNYPLTAHVHGRRLGVLGMGGIGTAIAARAAAFRMDIRYHCRRPKDVTWQHEPSLVTLARWADILCCVVPGGPATRHLVDATVLDALGPQGWLINVGRGSVVDEDALLQALATGQLAGAGLDVYADEPNVPAGLLALNNVICLPHVGSGTAATRLAMGDLVISNMAAVFAGERPATPVNEPVT